MKKQLISKTIYALMIVLLALAALPPFAVSASANVTVATGGSSISADTAATGGTGAYTTLTGPSLNESNDAGMSAGSMILTVPSGFQFDTTASSVTVTTNGNGGARINTTNTTVGQGTTMNVTPTTTTITIWITTASSGTGSGNRANFTWSGIKVRPTLTTPLASGNITYGGTSTGVTAGTNMGTLTEVLPTVACTWTSNNNNMVWTESARWSHSVPSVGHLCGSYPGAGITGDTVIISDGDTVSLDVTPAYSIASLQVGGSSAILRNDGTARTLTVTGNVTVNSGGTLRGCNGGGSGAFALVVQGNISNSGSFTNGTACSLNLTMSGAGAQSISGTTTLNTLTLSGSGSKTIPSGTSVTNTFSIAPTGTAKALLMTNLSVPTLILGGFTQDSTAPAPHTYGPEGSSANYTTNLYFDSSSTGIVTISASTPVTMNYFHAKYQSGSLSIDWSTGTETGNVGFNLYVVDANGKRKLNTQLIPSTGFTTHDPQDYRFAASGLALSGTITFTLEDIDFLGRTVLHGPFALDQVYGQRITGTLTNWQQIQAECSQHQVLGKRCAGYK